MTLKKTIRENFRLWKKISWQQDRNMNVYITPSLQYTNINVLTINKTFLFVMIDNGFVSLYLCRIVKFANLNHIHVKHVNPHLTLFESFGLNRLNEDEKIGLIVCYPSCSKGLLSSDFKSTFAVPKYFSPSFGNLCK